MHISSIVSHLRHHIRWCLNSNIVLHVHPPTCAVYACRLGVKMPAAWDGDVCCLGVVIPAVKCAPNQSSRAAQGRDFAESENGAVEKSRNENRRDLWLDIRNHPYSALYLYLQRLLPCTVDWQKYTACERKGGRNAIGGGQKHNRGHGGSRHARRPQRCVWVLRASYGNEHQKHKHRQKSMQLMSHANHHRHPCAPGILSPLRQQTDTWIRSAILRTIGGRPSGANWSPYFHCAVPMGCLSKRPVTRLILTCVRAWVMFVWVGAMACSQQSHPQQ